MRTHVVSIGGFLLGMSVAIVVLGVLALDVSAQQARATARTSATVIDLYFDDAGDHVAADLEWFDADGVRHVTLAQVGKDRELAPEVSLAIRYDPDHPKGLVFPGADDEFPPPGDWVPQERYVLTTFACGSNMGPAEAARHIEGITAREISLAKNRHITLAKLNQGDHRRGQCLYGAGRGQGMGRWQQRGRRRHPGRHLHRQPAGRDLDPIRGFWWYCLPLRIG